MDEIAAKAGVAKTTIYRRWASKAALVTATLRAVHSLDDAAEQDVDTGAVRSDLLALLREHVGKAATSVGMGIARMLGAELNDPEVEAITRELRAEKRAPLIAAVERGKARGELADTVDAGLVVELLAGAVFARISRFREPVDDAYLEAIVDLVLTGAGRHATLA
ncbi:MAG: TetR/AcrR family transcriptional regulator [Polyangiaceae bacterium]|nr:TetR/AcrR family transcriptional regulator [Polyangiaceae bacterium]